MRNCAILLVVLLTPIRVSGQTSSALEAERVKHYLTLAFSDEDEGEFWYEIDGHESAARAKPLGESLLLSSSQGFNLFSRFLNPLTHRLDVASEQRPDPVYESAGSFLEALAGLLTRTGLGEEFTAGLTSSTQQRHRTFLRTSIPGSKQVLLAPDLLEWVLITLPKERCFGQNADLFYDALYLADSRFYAGSLPSENRPSAQFNDNSRSAVSALTAPTSRTEMVSAHTTARAIQSSLREHNADSRSALDAVTDKVQTLDWNLAAEDCQGVDRYTQAAIARFAASAGAILSEREKVVAALGNLLSTVESYLKLPHEGDAIRIARVTLQRGQLTDVTVTVQRRTVALEKDNIEIAEMKRTAAKFTVREHGLVLPEFGAGMALVNFDFPRFGTGEEDGETVVAPPGKEDEHWIPAATLNLLFDIGSSFAVPIVQFGAGASEDAPALLLGGGIRLTRILDLAFTIGVATTWAEQLTELEPGDPVSGTAALQEDLQLRHHGSSLYWGIQYSF